MIRILIGVSIFTTIFNSTYNAYSQEKMNCRQECSDRSAFCLHLNDKLTRYSISDGFSGLYDILQGDQRMSISPSDLQNMFGLRNDPCKRSETKFNGGTILNTGSACRVSTSVASIGADSIKASVVVPEELKLEYRNNNGEILITTTHGASFSYIHLNDEFLNSDWGGTIWEIIFTREYAIIETDGGCIRYGF